MRLSKRRALLVFLALAGAGYGCKDFLITPPQGALDELTLANAAGVEGTLVGAYRLLGGMGMESAPSNWMYGSVTSDDAYKGSEPGDFSSIVDLELYNFSGGGADGLLNSKWGALYEGISRTNATLRLLDQLQKSDAGALSKAQADGIRGEALFLRAHFHFEAWMFWRNVPYYTETDAEFRKPNTGEVIPLVLKDLDQAISLLPATARNGERARVHQWTAKAYKGRVQAHAASMGAGGVTWPTALSTLRDVANNGPYRLEENFHRVWTGFTQFANGPETILAFQATVNDGDNAGWNSNWGERLNFPHSGSPFGCCGFHQPTQNLVNFFRVDANGLPLAIGVGDLTPLSAAAAWNAPFDQNFTAEDEAPVDPRLDWTVGRDGVPYKDWGIHSSATGWVRDISSGGFYNAKKNVHEKASGSQSNVGWNAQHSNGVNIHVFRFADLLLMLAEAEVEAGSLENARQLVNRIRERASKVAQGPGTSTATIAVPIDDPSITWANYEIGLYPSFPSKDYARTAVRYERRLELAMEGQRWFDLIRWGVAEPVINSYIAEEKTRRPHLASASLLTERHRLFPIPTRQIDLSEVDGESRLRQNPGY